LSRAAQVRLDGLDPRPMRASRSTIAEGREVCVSGLWCGFFVRAHGRLSMVRKGQLA
jgi:hypothetical protein